MAYTSIEQVRRFLADKYPVAEQVNDQRLVFSGLEKKRFYGGAVEQLSVQVKHIPSDIPVTRNLTLAAGDTTLGDNLIIPGTIVVASDSSLGIIYQEGSDYIILYNTGMLRLTAASALSSGMAVVVWYSPYARYTEGVDYSLNSDRGELRRLTSGGITDSETVWLDYRPLRDNVSDDAVSSAVRAANDMIEQEIDPDVQFEADPTLSMAATYRALELVCRISATRHLTFTGPDDRVALAWLKLAESFAEQSTRLMAAFKPARDDISSPRHA